MQQKLMNVFEALAENLERFWNSARHNFRSQKEDVCRQREVFGHSTQEKIPLLQFSLNTSIFLLLNEHFQFPLWPEKLQKEAYLRRCVQHKQTCSLTLAPLELPAEPHKAQKNSHTSFWTAAFKWCPWMAFSFDAALLILRWQQLEFKISFLIGQCPIELLISLPIMFVMEDHIMNSLNTLLYSVAYMAKLLNSHIPNYMLSYTTIHSHVHM